MDEKINRLKEEERKSDEEIVKLLEKHDFKWSWYSDYPTQGFWNKDFSQEDYREALDTLTINSSVWLYIHFPFCLKKCLFCACPSEANDKIKEINNFLKHLFKEIELLNDYFKSRGFKPNIPWVHFGGGSPSLMNKEQTQRLVEKINLLVDINKLREFSIEIDPRTVNKEKLSYYSELGITRISLGVQDFDPKVQEAIGRIQPKETIKELLAPQVRRSFESINFDLIYGLPYQTRKTFRNTIEEFIELSPDRISSAFMYYNPEALKHQRALKPSTLPSFSDKNMMYLEAIKKFTEAGYLLVGLGHFAKPNESLAKALKNKTLRRSQMGFTSGLAEDFIGLGTYAQGRINNYYYHNTSDMEDYCNAVDNKKFPVLRGYVLTNDEVIRRRIIHDIFCFNAVYFKEIEKKYNINFRDYFREELRALDFYIKEGMIRLFSDKLVLTYLGTFFQRHISTCFDRLFNEGKKYKHLTENIS